MRCSARPSKAEIVVGWGLFVRQIYAAQARAQVMFHRINLRAEMACAMQFCFVWGNISLLWVALLDLSCRSLLAAPSMRIVLFKHNLISSHAAHFAGGKHAFLCMATQLAMEGEWCNARTTVSKMLHSV